MRIEHHPKSIDDLVEAAWFYEQRCEGLGEALLGEVQTGILAIRNDPLQFPAEHGDKRRCPVTRFPYCIYYRLIGDAIRILAIKHHSQNDEELAGRD